MDNLLARFIKRNNKKRGINISIATMVIFLLGSFGVVAKDIEGSFENKEEITEQVTIKGTNLTAITNKGTIVGEGNIIGSNKNIGNGIAGYSDTSLKINNIENSGKIKGKVGNVTTPNNNAGNGIGLYTTIYTKIETVKNSGDILGESGSVESSASNIGNGLGVYTLGHTVDISNIENSGNISGKASYVRGLSSNIGNGIGVYSQEDSKIESIDNTGTISGEVAEILQSKNINAGNGIGIYGHKSVTVGDINNSGVITGKAEKIEGKEINAGNGIGIYSWNYGSTIGKINNTGIIMGSNSAISVVTPGFTNESDTINNYGILLGKTPVDISNNEKIKTNNQGLMVTINENGEIQKIETGNQTSEKVNYKNVDYTVINGKISGTTTETIKASELGEKTSKLVLNGIDNTLTVDTSLTLDNSIINGYKTAVKVEGNNIFTGNNVTINGGGLDGQTAVIVGDDLGNTVKLSGNSVINGNINLGGGKDLLVFGNEVSTYSTGNSSMNITGNIAGVETIDVNQRVIFGENSKVTGTEQINIGANGSLELTLKTEGDKSSHALTGSGVTIFGNNNSSTGDVVLKTNGIGNGTTVDMTGVKLDNVSLGVNSILYTAEKVGDGSSIKINTDGNLENIINGGGSSNPDTGDGTDSGNNSILDLANGINYDDLNTIVTSLMTSGINTNELNNLIGTEAGLSKEKQKEYLVKYLAETYAASPYSLSAELSRKSTDMFENVVIGKDLEPELGKWAVYGGFTHIDGDSQDSYYGVDNQVYTTNAYGVDTDIKLKGIYVMGEYGLQDNLTAGVILGGNQGKSKLSNGSKVEGNNIYLGAFAKKYVGNLRLLAGAGYQYGDFQADRYSLGADKIRHYDSDYNDNTFDIYADVKYSHKLAENVYLEPNIGISHIYVSQDSTKESGTLGMETSSKDFNYTTLKTGVDVRKDIVTTKAKHSVSAGVFYEKMLDGAKEDKLEAKFNNSTKSMNLLVAEKNEDRVGVRAKYEVELQNGVTFDVKGSYTFARDTHQGDMKHKDNGEWRVGAGIGYRF